MKKNTTRARRAQERATLFVLLCLFGVAACSESRGAAGFRLLSASETGVDFANAITTTDSLNVQTDVYIYNGAGVGVGDVNNDGLPDIFFAGNMVSSRLYLNKGKMHFEDVTKAAGVTTNRWATGVAMVDVNDDGYLDIYVSVSGPEWSKPAQRANLLFVNNHNGTFTEEAARYGIADTGFTTQAAFLDYDRDGCLDLFLLENSPKDFTRGVMSHPAGLRGTTPGSYNQLYHNDCPGGHSGTFTNVSERAGMLHDAGYGLGVAVADLNMDGWPDIYVSNDGTPNDVVYINNRNGTFTNKAAQLLKHASLAGMGVDIADFNDDGRPDILQVDMMPSDLARRKRTTGATSYASIEDARNRGFRQDYSENSLQLSNGATNDGEPVFSEIARMAGVAHTDWSWSALFADFDNDGRKDIFIGNGYPKAVNDLDYMAALYGARQRGDIPRARKLLQDLPSYDFPNYVFRNNGDLTFTDETTRWGLEAPALSYGAAYADLNNDGRLDLVVNNINQRAFIYENVSVAGEHKHYLEINLIGEPGHQLTAGVGAEIVATVGGKKQYLYSSPFRGFMSSVDQRLHFGLGEASRVDTLEVQWPDGRHQVLTNVAADRLISLKETDASAEKRDTSISALHTLRSGAPWFVAQSIRGLEYTPPPAAPLDFSVQPLLPYELSKHGPPLAVGDVNGDGLEDLFIGGVAGQGGKLLLQRRDGSFTAAVAGQPWALEKQYEDWGATFFDANGDGRPDLYVASGGYRLAPTSSLLQDRLYINQGNGKFVRDSSALSVMLTSTAAVRVGDFNGDGRPDLFVGGRLSPRNYPYPTRSYILRNDGGHFTDVTASLAPELIQPGGMITDALWIDFDGDGRLDLVTAGEWMPLHFYRNEGTRFRDVTASMHLPPLRGWWYSLASGDFDKDGRPDIVAGNLGLNYSYTTADSAKFGIYAGNFAGNQSPDVVLTQQVKGEAYPISGSAQLAETIYTLGVRFPTAGSFSGVSMSQAFGTAALKSALHYEADTFASMYLHNDGKGAFSASPLPMQAQISPIKAIVVTDVDGDGNLDLIVGGNLYEAEPNTAPADAGNGLWLRGDGRGHFTPVAPSESGLLAPFDLTGLAAIRTSSSNVVVAVNTTHPVQTYVIRKR